MIMDSAYDGYITHSAINTNARIYTSASRISFGIRLLLRSMHAITATPQSRITYRSIFSTPAENSSIFSTDNSTTTSVLSSSVCFSLKISYSLLPHQRRCTLSYFIFAKIKLWKDVVFHCISNNNLNISFSFSHGYPFGLTKIKSG